MTTKERLAELKKIYELKEYMYSDLAESRRQELEQEVEAERKLNKHFNRKIKQENEQ